MDENGKPFWDWGDTPLWLRIVLIIMAIIGVLIVIYAEITGELP